MEKVLRLQKRGEYNLSVICSTGVQCHVFVLFSIADDVLSPFAIYPSLVYITLQGSNGIIEHVTQVTIMRTFTLK